MTGTGGQPPGPRRPGLLPLALALLSLGAGGLCASPPEHSPLPRWRDAGAPGVEVAAALPRPADRVAAAAMAAAAEGGSGRASVQAVARSIRPAVRPKRLAAPIAAEAVSFRVQPQPEPKSSRKAGAVCGLPGVEGVKLKAIASTVQGCGLDEPIRVSAVEGLGLSTPAIMDCATAGALSDWVRDAVIPGIGRRGGGAAGLQVAAHYTCRGRNNVRGARISEHGRGRAIDISGIILRNGTVLSVLEGWGDAKAGPILKALHRAACGPFGTVLGPAADGHHRDHFHLDTAAYRSGSYCR